jgi:hypothetical protein
MNNSKHFEKTEKHEQKTKVIQNEKLNSKLGCLFYIVGIICVTYSGRAFNFSIFEFKYYVILMLLFGVVADLVISFIRKKKYIINYSKTWEYIFLGNIIFTCIFITNEYGSLSKNYNRSFNIISKHYRTKRGVNSVEIYYNGITQEINLPKNMRDEVEKAQIIQTELNKGLLGITTIVSTKLEEK